MDAVFLGLNLWWATFHDPWSFALGMISVLGLLISLVLSIAMVASSQSKRDVYRVGVNLVFLLLLFPTLRLGAFLSDELFLKRLRRFQEVTDVLISSEREKAGSNVFSVGAALPVQYSNLGVKPRVLVKSTDKNATAEYMFRDSSAVGHAGYVYRSDDDVAALHREYPSFGFKRLALNWFYFSD